MIRTECEEYSLSTVARKSPDAFYSRYRLTGYMLCSHIPRPSLTRAQYQPSYITSRYMIEDLRTHPSEYCRTLPFFDHAHQCWPGSVLSLRFKIRIVFGDSAIGGLETLHIRRSPSIVCEANMSDFCFVDEACQAKLTIGEGARWVVRVWRMVKLRLGPLIGFGTMGSSLTSRMEPF